MADYGVIPEAIRFTSATIVPAEGARVAVVTCEWCGAALLIDPREPLQPIMLHTAWHERTQP